MWFPHDKETDSNEIYDKYKRRFYRLYQHLNDRKNLFILVTRHYYINPEAFDKIINILLSYNSDNQIIFISGTDHPYLINDNPTKYENVRFKYIHYDLSKFYGYDYTDFRPKMQTYLEEMLC
jgi:hypothetical protein